MELPALAAPHGPKVRFGSYVAARLKLRKLDDKAAAVLKITARLKDTHQRLDEVSGEIYQAIAERDFWIEAYENRAAEFYDTVNTSGGLHPVKRSIFQNKHNYYIEVPLEELAKRGNELVDRLERFLPPKAEQLKKKTAKALRRRIEAFEKAAQKLADARAALDEAERKRRKTVKRWDQTLKDVYAAVVEKLGEDEAARIFPPVEHVQKMEGEDRAGSLGKADEGMTLQRLALRQR